MESKPDCGYKCGTLPSCAPLAVSYVPMQQSVNPRYDANEALMRGTLFPGLELPFMNVVNTKDVAANTPMGELMALHFVCDELRLYLDTHADDKEAFELLKTILALKKEAHKRYTEKYGPVSFDDLLSSNSYTWVCDPWPWNYPGKV